QKLERKLCRQRAICSTEVWWLSPSSATAASTRLRSFPSHSSTRLGSSSPHGPFRTPGLEAAVALEQENRPMVPRVEHRPLWTDQCPALLAAPNGRLLGVFRFHGGRKPTHA